MIVYLLLFYFLIVFFLCCCIYGRKTEPKPSMGVRFAIREGYTILGVMDTPKIVCFCIGQDVVEEKEYE